MHGFQRETPVVWMAAGTVPPAAERRHYVLWPALAYLVLAPTVGDRPTDRLDIFALSVLRLFRADVRDTRDVAALLHLDPRLTAYIAAALRDQHLCDDHQVPTPRGERALEEADDRRAEIVKGYVFQDPGSRTVWGRFVERLELVEADWTSGRPRLQLGTAGSPETRTAWAIDPRSLVNGAPPSTADVLGAVRAHRRATARGRGEVPGGAALGETENIQRTRVIGSRPIALWLTTVLYAADLDQEGAAWNVIDPFGLGRSPYLRALVESRARDEDATALRSLLGRVTAPPGEDDRSADRQRTEYAREALEPLGTALARLPDLKEQLLDALVATERAERASRLDVHRVRVTEAACAALEIALARWLPEGARQDLAIDLVDDHDHDAALLRARAGAIGFDDLPHGLLAVPAWRIRAVLSHRDGSLRPLTLAIILAATEDPAHPLWVAAARRPALLADIDAVAGARDRAADNDDALDRGEIGQIAELTLAVVEQLLDDARPVPEGVLHGQ